MAAALLALGLAAPMLLPGCASGFGGDFLTDKHSNLTLRSFETVSTGATSTTGGTGGTSGGSTSAANGGPTGPKGGNPTDFVVRFDPFPSGALVLLNDTMGTTIDAVSSDNRVAPLNIEVTFTGHDINGNTLRIQSFLTASGLPDSSTLGSTSGGGGGGGTSGSTGSSTSGGETLSTLRPQYITVTNATSISQSTTTSSGGQSSTTNQTGTSQIYEVFPTTIGARFSITNGISVWLDSITLRYFELDGSLANVSAYTNRLNTFLEAGPVSTGFSASAGGGQ